MKKLSLNQLTNLHAILRPTAATFALLCITLTAHATERHVPLPYTTIQAAIDASTNGDTVMIDPGTYTENINLKGKNITVRAFNTNFDTIIDGNQAGPVVTFAGNETANCVVRNLVIRNGKASNGAGIVGNNSLATIRNCTIGLNTATGNGGGIYGMSGNILNCTITQNTAANGAGISDCEGTIDSCQITQNTASVSGGGIFNSPGLIQFCEITNNKANNKGGGIASSDGIIRANLIAGNQVTATGPLATPAAFGAGIDDAGGTVTLNTIASNDSAGDGGGVSNSDGILQNNIVAKNTARRGAGMSNCAGRVENNTIWGNNAITIGGGCFNMGTLVANCIIFSNSATNDQQWSGANVPTYSCVQGWTGGQPDIITADPLLTDPAKNKFNLLPQSPCIDAGKFIPELTIDFEGETRPFNGTPNPAGDGSDFDIGADEFKPDNIDLVASFVTVTTKYKGDVPKLKGSIKGQMIVANTGTDITEATAYVQFFLSADTVLDPTDTPVGKIVSLKKLKGGKAKKIKCNVKLPLNQTVTGQYLIGWADTSNTVSEGNELNNLAISAPLP